MIHWEDLYKNGRDFRLINKFLLEKILFVRSGKALDIGCGTGQLASLLVERGFDVYGVDLSENAIEQASKRTKGRFEVRDIEKDFPEGKFDLISCKLVFAFIQNKQIFFQNVAEHLSDDGQFLLITPIAVEGEIYDDHYRAISVAQVELKNDVFQGVSTHYDYDSENELVAYISYKRK